MPTVRTLTSVPAEEKDEIVRDFRSEGASVQEISEKDGSFTVIATFPDNAEDEESTPDITGTIDDYNRRVKLPSALNPGLSHAHQSTMLDILGIPGPKEEDCKPITNQRLASLLNEQNVGPFSIKGLAPAIETLKKVFDRVKQGHPTLYSQLGTAGMLCCRKVRSSRSSSFSNHSWGTAIDLKINDQLDDVNDDKCQIGLMILAPYFNDEGFYWGAGFSREDSMHFEASNELIKNWHSAGKI